MGGLGSTMSGYVYILTNSAMPGLVKIGSTTMNPHDRAKQLHTTGVPAPFKVHGFVKVTDHGKVEKSIHKKLSRFRQSNDREFFAIEPEEAVKILESVSGQYEMKRREEAKEAKFEEVRRIHEEKRQKRQRLAEERYLQRHSQRNFEVQTKTIDIPTKRSLDFRALSGGIFRILIFVTYLIGLLMIARIFK